MKFKKVVCPHCGGKLKIEDSEEKFICPFCESTLETGDGGKITVVDGKSDAKKEKKNKRKKNNSKIAIFVTLGVILLIIAVAYIFRHQIINYFTEPEDPNKGGRPYGTVETTDETSPVDDSKYKEKIYNFLICGHDRVADLTDVSMLVSFNVSNLTASIMQLPRDIFVNYDNPYYRKINGVFQYYMTNDSSNEYIQNVLDKYDKETEPEMRGIAGYAAFLEQNLCLKIHYFAVMDLNQFGAIVDALGGVEMNVPFDLDYEDPDQGLYIHVSKGYQVLDGHAAEGVVRYRSGFAMADIGRGNVQKMFMTSLFKTIQDKANIFNIGKITDVCGIISDNLVTNMTTSDMIYFVNNAMTLDMQYITFMTMPGAGFWGDEEFPLAYYTLNKEAALNYINSYFNIYKEPVTIDEIDANGVFYNNSYYYSCPASEMTEYIYKASDMTSDDFVPVVGY